VSFEGDRVGLLDLSHPRASVWMKMIEYLQRNNRPVYVEIDPDTEIITRLHVPEAARVWRIRPQGEDVVYVAFHTSSARHYLRRAHPDFESMLNALQAALDTGTRVLVTSTHPDFEVIDVRPLPPTFGVETPPGPPAPPVPDPPVTWDRAVELFNMMNAQSCVPCSATDPCIPFKYPRDGCWIRAHLMCYLMMDQGETPEKVWIDSPGCDLLALTSNVPECQVPWCWHVAPTLMVKQASGPDVKMVIDPSLCDKPVTLDEWKLLQGDPSAALTFSSWDKYGHGGGTATQAQANNDMERYRICLDGLCADYGPSPYACPIAKKIYFIVDRSTISRDEIEAMLSTGSPAAIEAAFFVVVDGFTPAELGITASTLVGVPNIKPTFVPPTVPQMTVEVMPSIGLEDPVHLARRQRITWKYKICFTGTSGFVSELQELTLSASIQTVSASAKIYLITQPNPYETDGETAWLSTDLRVFQIKAGESRFGKTMGTDASDFITTVVDNLNNGTAGGQTFESISVDQQTSRLELSQSVDGGKVYNFAIAKVRYRALSIPAQDVRVFFRLFPASSTSVEYDQATTYRRATQGGSVKPLLGIIGGKVVTIPCFAAARVDSSTTAMTAQTDPANVQQMAPDATGKETVRYFGCWLDINQTEPQFPVYPAPTDGPFPAASRISILEHMRNQHQCLVAEIAFDPAPILAPASPSTSDKLAQRNLAIVESANPGDMASHRIPHTFEIKPTRTNRRPDEVPDELMIDWGNTPIGSRATLYLPAVDTRDVLKLAVNMYRSHRLVRVDAHTLQCESGGVTYIPIPEGQGANYAGMMSVDLPETVKRGQVFTIVVRQVTGAVGGHAPLTRGSVTAASAARGRRILGSFQITIPVRAKEDMLVREERLLSNLRWIAKAIPADDRWFPVFSKYVQQIAGRVDALGGESKKVIASASGEWRKAYLRCRMLGLAVALLIAALGIGIGALTGYIMGAAVIPIAAVLAGVTGLWIKRCRPGICQWLGALIVGAGIGAIVLAFLTVLGISAQHLGATFWASAGVVVGGSIVCWVRRCFR
jgi:hypothetical protein